MCDREHKVSLWKMEETRNINLLTAKFFPSCMFSKTWKCTRLAKIVQNGFFLLSLSNWRRFVMRAWHLQVYKSVNWSLKQKKGINGKVLSIGYRCADGRFLMSQRGVAVSNHSYLSSSETRVKMMGITPIRINLMPGICWWYLFHKKVKSSFSTTLDIFKPQLKCSVFKCISWLTSSFFGGWTSGFSERGSQDLSNGAKVAS
jgi:hypothetical protein